VGKTLKISPLSGARFFLAEENRNLLGEKAKQLVLFLLCRLDLSKRIQIACIQTSRPLGH
jgi:hypothetical protein